MILIIGLIIVVLVIFIFLLVYIGILGIFFMVYDKMDVKGGNEIDDIILKVAELVENKEMDIIYTYNKLGEIKYFENKRLKKLGCHVGQRKLMLTEIQFLSSCVKNYSDILIYVGSAPCEHLPVLLKMYPDKKFLLIDPNYHRFDHDYIYVYQNTKVIDQPTKRIVNDSLKYKNDKVAFKRKMYNTVKRLKNAQFYNDEKYDVVQYNVEKMTNIKKEFERKNYKTLISDILSNDDRVYIIQDYMTLDLCKYIKYSLDVSNAKFSLISDIRTNITNTAPTDIDIMWNDALQMIFINELKPIYSMLKYHPPYFNTPESIENPESYISDDLDYIKKNYGVDMIKEYKEGKYLYFKAEEIWLQAWAPVGSSECRLIINGNNIEYENYNPKEWENRFNYLNMIRGYAFFPSYFSKVSDTQEYDGCFDCNLEMAILCNYIEKKTDNLFELEPSVLDDQKNVKKLLELKKVIDDVLIWPVNQKCGNHGEITAPLKGLKFYRTSTDDVLYCSIPVEGEIKNIDVGKIDKVNRNIIEYDEDFIYSSAESIKNNNIKFKNTLFKALTKKY